MTDKLLDFDKVADFGGIDADSDQLLDQCFEDHKAYLDARGHQRTVILGRKGSGKTAIFRRLTRIKSEDVCVSGHLFSDYPWHHHSKQKEVGVPDEQCFVSSWEYLIYVTMAKLVLSRRPDTYGLEKIDRDLKLLENFLKDTYGTVDPEISKIFSPGTKLQFSGDVGVDAKFLKAKISAKEITIEYLPIKFSEINIKMKNTIIECADPNINYYVCFDELDLGFSLDKEEYKNQIMGIIFAARKINNSARDGNKNISIIIFLRDDIYNMLHFEDKNKITNNSVSVIEWDMDRSSPSLKALMEKRFHQTLGIPANGAWERVFDETKQMAGHQTKYKHIIDRTFLRPRDIIKFCNEILNQNKNSKSKSNQTKFDSKNVADARKKYSEYLLNELDDEIRKHIPNYRSYLEVFRSIGSIQFTISEFEQAPKSRSDIDLGGEQTRSILSSLFEFSVVGFLRSGGSGFGGSQYVWRHVDRNIKFNEQAQKYRVHYGFAEVLDLKKFRKS